MNEDIQQIIRVMTGTYERDISHFDGSFLLKTLEKRLAFTSIRTLAGYCEYLAFHAGEAEELYNSLYVRYSEFFRNPLTFAMLEQLVLPILIGQKQKSGQTEIRVWSAGCAAGQESYSLTILLDDLITTSEKQVSYRIFATDISETELALGRSGVYDLTALQNVRLKHFKSFFESNHETWSVSRHLKDRIEFSSYDLLDEHSASPPGSIFGDFDLILCCNLLFYYHPDSQQFILSKIHQTLADGGYLGCGETERAIVEKTDLFAEVCRPSALYRKRTSRDNL
jgi:chemotaxis protein methyltransferase CheR